MLEMTPQEGDRQGRERCFSLYHGYGKYRERDGDRDGVIASEMDLKGRREEEIKGQRERARERERTDQM